jgi:hypothetical protein
MQIIVSGNSIFWINMKKYKILIVGFHSDRTGRRSRAPNTVGSCSRGYVFESWPGEWVF